MSLIDNISQLQRIPTLSKHEHLVNGIIDTIESGSLKKGDQLPSINSMVSQMGYARKTIVKAYEELKSRGIVESKNFRGYFIASEETNSILKIALVLYAFHSFQESFYNSFRDNLSPNVEIDVFFHHNNVDILETIMSRIDRKYGFYVVAPIQDERVRMMLEKISPEKLLIVDRHLKMSNEYSQITQEFEKSTYNKLVELLPSIKKFKRLIFLYKKGSDTPLEAMSGFKRFISDNAIEGKIIDSYQDGEVQRGSVYFVMIDDYLWRLLKDCRDENITIGKEVGIIGHDDSLVKEMIFGGITTISTDFPLMGKLSAEHIHERSNTHHTIPTYLNRRSSI